MTLNSIVTYYLWFAPHVILLALLVVLFRRGINKKFPVFSSYVAYEIIQFAIIAFMVFSPVVTGAQYFIVYTFLLAGSVAFRFGVIYEIFVHTFNDYAPLVRFSKPLFRWITVILLAIGLGLIACTKVNRADDLLIFQRYVLNRAASIVQCGLLVCLFGVSSFFGLSWRKYALGIALGMGVFTCVDLIFAAIRAQFGYMKWFDFVTMGTYHLCVLIWLGYVLVPERSAKSSELVKSLPQHADITSWNTELERMLQ